jgi:hypothetical protein
VTFLNAFANFFGPFHLFHSTTNSRASKSGRMFALLVSAIRSAVSCDGFSDTDCGYCFSESAPVNLSCGFCLSTRKCVEINGTDPSEPEDCEEEDWMFEAGDPACKNDSSIALPQLARILVGLFAALVAFITLLFWIWIFPRLFILDPQSLLTVNE